MSASPGVDRLWIVPETIMYFPGTMSPHSFGTLMFFGSVVSSSLPHVDVDEPHASLASSSGSAGTGGTGPFAATAAAESSSTSCVAPAVGTHASAHTTAMSAAQIAALQFLCIMLPSELALLAELPRAQERSIRPWPGCA